MCHGNPRWGIPSLGCLPWVAKLALKLPSAHLAAADAKPKAAKPAAAAVCEAEGSRGRQACSGKEREGKRPKGRGVRAGARHGQGVSAEAPHLRGPHQVRPHRRRRPGAPLLPQV
uniref:Uncharacterized protein n=1 Tax=Arundo donax TaxID=35708 RepID=A0A0A9IT10_ARUDO